MNIEETLRHVISSSLTIACTDSWTEVTIPRSVLEVYDRLCDYSSYSVKKFIIIIIIIIIITIIKITVSELAMVNSPTVCLNVWGFVYRHAQQA